MQWQCLWWLTAATTVAELVYLFGLQMVHEGWLSFFLKKILGWVWLILYNIARFIFKSI